jgi:hypothetical protein
MRLAVILPIRDGAAGIEAQLRALAPLRHRGHSLIVVDGGSRDDAAVRARPLADRVLLAPRGWSFQANAGARAAEAETAQALVFLPSGVSLPRDADREIARALDNGPSPWGFFAQRLDAAPTGGRAARLALGLGSALANAGARLSASALAEQAIFVTRAAFLALEGFDDAEDPPDIGFCRRARLLGAPLVLRPPVGVAVGGGPGTAILRGALRRECWRLACAWDLPWRPRPPARS